MEDERIGKLEKEMKEIKNMIRNIDRDELDERIHNIENHIYRRRSPFMTKGQ